jgi:hypothetical protein
MIDLEGKTAGALGQRVQHLDAGGNDFGADPVTRDRCDGIGLHEVSPEREVRRISDG